MLTVAILDQIKNADGSPRSACSGYGDNGEHESFGLYEVELMQFIGLHDKNGKEIYEGDLVSHGRLQTGYPLMVKIGGYWPTEGDSGWGVHVHNEDETFVESVSPFDQDNNLEVINNIYEDAERLQPQPQ